MSEQFTIRELTPETWDAFAALVERHNGIFGGCWCIWFHPDCAERGQGADGNRALKRKLVEEGKAHAALVFDGDRAVAWCEFGTPEELPNIHHRKEYQAGVKELPDYRLTCIFIDKAYRRRGLSRLALRGALDLIAQAGGGVVEGYPQDLSTRDPAKKMSDSFLYNLTRKSYEDAGFTYVRPKGQQNCVMSKVVEPGFRDASLSPSQARP